MSKSPIVYINKDWFDDRENKIRKAGFYFYDESWSYVFGPYKTKSEASRALKQYCEQL